MTQDDDIKALRAALEAGPTPGEWVLADDGKDWTIDAIDQDSARYYPSVSPNRADWMLQVAANPTRIARLLDRLEAAEADAGRYQWLREERQKVPGPCAYKPWDGPPIFGNELDAAIDQARAAMQAKELTP